MFLFVFSSELFDSAIYIISAFIFWSIKFVSSDESISVNALGISGAGVGESDGLALLFLPRGLRGITLPNDGDSSNSSPISLFGWV